MDGRPFTSRLEQRCQEGLGLTTKRPNIEARRSAASLLRRWPRWLRSGTTRHSLDVRRETLLILGSAACAEEQEELFD